MRKRIMLIYPPGDLYQRGEDRSQGNIQKSSASSMHACNDIGYAAAVLLKRGYSVFLRDYQTERAKEGDLNADILAFEPDMFVLSTTNSTVYSDIALINRISDFHKCIFVLKGALFYDPEPGMLALLDLSSVTYLIGGEIDFVIGRLADCIWRGINSIDKVPNILYKKDNGFIKTEFHLWDEDLDGQPFPARQLMKNELYVRPDTGETMATIQVSRGCPANCIYCLSPNISGRKIRYRDLKNIYEEISDCYYNFNIRNFFFKSDTFTFDEKWTEELCDLIIQSPLHNKIEFTANSRVRPLHKNTLLKMKTAGCFTIAFGFESGNDNTLSKIKKGTSVADNRQAMSWAKEIGLTVFGFYMIGFPWETKEDIADTIKLMFELDADFVEIHIALPYYGTELYDVCKEYSLIKTETLGYDYFDPNTAGTCTLSIEELASIRKKALLKYHLRLSYIKKRLTEGVKDRRVLKRYFIYGLRMLFNLYAQKK